MRWGADNGQQRAEGLTARTAQGPARGARAHELSGWHAVAAEARTRSRTHRHTRRHMQGPTAQARSRRSSARRRTFTTKGKFRHARIRAHTHGAGTQSPLQHPPVASIAAPTRMRTNSRSRTPSRATGPHMQPRMQRTDPARASRNRRCLHSHLHSRLGSRLGSRALNRT